jgi:hypothetical protein
MKDPRNDSELTIEIDECFPGYAVGNIIVKANTGILITSRVNGGACSNPKIEGFYMNIFLNTEQESLSFMKKLIEFGDCEKGCAIGFDGWNSEDMSDKDYQEYARSIDDFLLENINDKEVSGSLFKFDYSRINELMEGWWPVVVRLKNYNYPAKGQIKWCKKELMGYLCFGNCD